MSQFAAGYDEADQPAMVALGRARLLREAAGHTVLHPQLRARLLAEADTFIADAMADIWWFGAEHGESYFHETDGQLCLGWAIPGEELARTPEAPA